MEDTVKVKDLNDALEMLTINLNDAKNKLEVISCEKAEEIRNYMQNADISEIGDYKLISYLVSEGNSITLLHKLGEDNIYRSLEITEHAWDYRGRTIEYARTGDRIIFLNDLEELTTAIKEECTNLTATINKLLNIIQNIIY